MYNISFDSNVLRPHGNATAEVKYSYFSSQRQYYAHRSKRVVPEVSGSDTVPPLYFYGREGSRSALCTAMCICTLACSNTSCVDLPTVSLGYNVRDLH